MLPQALHHCNSCTQVHIPELFYSNQKEKELFFYNKKFNSYNYSRPRSVNKSSSAWCLGSTVGTEMTRLKKTESAHLNGQHFYFRSSLCTDERSLLCSSPSRRTETVSWFPLPPPIKAKTTLGNDLGHSLWISSLWAAITYKTCQVYLSASSL